MYLTDLNLNQTHQFRINKQKLREKEHQEWKKVKSNLKKKTISQYKSKAIFQSY